MAVEVEKSEGKAGVPERAKGSFLDLREEMDRAFDDFLTLMPFRPWRTALRGGLHTGFEVAVPAIDVVENEKTFRITAELPGIEEKDVDVSLRDDILTIRGEKKQEREEKDGTRRVSERAYGSFVRSMRLPAGVEADKIAADFKKGVLTISLPKSAEAQKRERRIEVKGS